MNQIHWMFRQKNLSIGKWKSLVLSPPIATTIWHTLVQIRIDTCRSTICCCCCCRQRCRAQVFFFLPSLFFFFGQTQEGDFGTI